MTITVSPCPDSANCSKVPSSASLLNSASSDSSDDSSAATQSTPGAMSRSSDSCTLKPSGNSVVTIKKNTSGCSSCSGRRKLRHSSRRTTSIMACQAPTLTEPSSKRRVVAAELEIMMRDHERHARRRSHAPPATPDRSCDPAVSRLVKGSSSSQRRRLQRQHPGHGHAAALSRRQNPHGQIRASADARTLQVRARAPVE